MSSETQVPVLIIGGGIVGLSASLCLSHYGIESMVIERHSGTSIHPRARSVNARTMELYRGLGIEDRVREAGASVSHNGKRISTLDLSGKSFVLLAGAEGASWLDAAKKVSSTLDIDIAAYCAGPDGDLVTSSKGEFESAAGISSRGAILVRPDDFVVWRQRKQQPSDHQVQLEQAMRQALCLQT